MRLLKLGIYHQTYLRDFYSVRVGLDLESYADQHRALIDDCYGSSDFWTRALGSLGYETLDTIANAKHLQTAWARENDFRIDEKAWLFQIAGEQIKRFRPEILLVADYSTFSSAFLREVRRECPSLKLILGWCGAPYDDSSVFGEWDVALSCVPEMVSGFRAQGVKSYHVNHAFASRVLDRIDTTPPPVVDFGFIGSVVSQGRFHVERQRLLTHLLARTNLQIWSGRTLAAPRGISGAILSSKLREFFSVKPRDQQIASRCHPAVFGLEMFQKLREMRVSFNNHIDISPVSASNMRLFETTGVGSCLITDEKKNLSELFEPGKEIVTYASAEDCVEKVRYLLENEGKRLEIAEAGQLRTLRNHTFRDRAAGIDEIIRKNLNSISRPKGSSQPRPE